VIEEIVAAADGAVTQLADQLSLRFAKAIHASYGIRLKDSEAEILVENRRV
jgi:hypothetical protein